MVVQLTIYLVPSLPLYYSFQTFQFINTSPFEEHAFVLKSQVALNELEPNSINIICSFIIEKYTNHPNQYELLSLVEFSFLYNIKKKIQNIANPKLLGL
jgi:hypothetical protein